MRLPYAPSIAPKSDPETHGIYSRISARRHPRPLIPLDLTFLHSPPVADGYNAFVGALRTATIFPTPLLELSICRVAVLNGAVYEWNAHAPLALKAGLARTVLQRAMKLAPEELVTKSPHGTVPGLSKEEHAVLLYTDEMTRDIKVKDETFARLKHLFNEREIVELTATIGGYNCVSRFLVALDVGENNGKRMKTVDEVEAELKKGKPESPKIEKR